MPQRKALPDQQTLIEASLTQYENASTRETLSLALTHLTRWLDKEGHGHVAHMTAPLFHLYASHLSEQGLAQSTLAGRMGAIKRFFDYLVRSGTIKESPVPVGWVLKQPRGASEEPLVSQEEVLSLLGACTDLDGQLVVALSGLDGIKAQFIYGLTAEDVTFNATGHALIPLRRASGATHTVPLSVESSRVLREAISTRPSGPLLLPSNPGDRRTANRRVASAAKRAGLGVRVTMRSLQKSYRAALLAQGVRVEVMTDLLGLRDSNRTYSYGLFPKHGPGTEGNDLLSTAAHESDALELLRQAEKLCDQADVTPIAPIVIAGAALEMVLRRMCEQKDAVPAGKESIDAYSTALRRRQLISKHTHATIQTNGKLRNEAAHGTESADLTIDKARLMISSILLFVAGRDDED